MTELPQELARASAMLDVRRFDEASALLAQLVSAEPDSGRAWCLMARASSCGSSVTGTGSQDPAFAQIGG